uniref:Glycine N-acyltransferase-like protein n=1 Tax=Serinus canaria TaxID=9135 RepID=A0A8C9UDJ5_SERCA
MLILRCPAQLQLLEETLRKSLPTTLPVLGTVMTVARGNPASHEVLVDSWPNFSIVLTRLRPEVLSWVPLPWQQHPTPQATQSSWMQDGLDEAVQDVASARGLKVETIRLHVPHVPLIPDLPLLSHPPRALPEPDVPARPGWCHCHRLAPNVPAPPRARQGRDGEPPGESATPAGRERRMPAPMTESLAEGRVPGSRPAPGGR